MASRNLTEQFLKLRSSSTRQRLNEHSGLLETRIEIQTEPEWKVIVERVEKEILSIEGLIEETHELYKQQALPGFDDKQLKEISIENHCRKITEKFHFCQKQIRHLNSDKISKNIQQKLASNVQQLTVKFKKMQSKYIYKLQQQEEKLKSFSSSEAKQEQIYIQKILTF